MGIISRKIGVLGGGQLGKMLCNAAQPWHLDISILDKSEDFPAAPYCTRFVKGDFTNYHDVVDFGQSVDVLTIEIEKVNQEALEYLEEQGLDIRPAPGILSIIRDKGKQAEFYKDHDIKTPAFKIYDGKDAIMAALQGGEIAFPFVQKLRTDGYDGRGVSTIQREQELDKLMEGPSICQEMIDIKKELAVIVARGRDGQITTYDPVEMVFHPEANLLEYQLCPAQISSTVETKLRTIALEVAKAFELVGILAIEFFLDKEDEIWVNEAAPRPHNSGHHTIETCECSQYEQLIRTLLDLPLGSTRLLESSVMMNLLGEEGKTGPAKIEGIAHVMRVDGAHLHLYGKETTKPFRKMGHILLSGADKQELIKQSVELKTKVKITT